MKRKGPIFAIALLLYMAWNFPVVLGDSWFDEYGSIPWEEERLHLDNFAIYLERNTEMKGYIIYHPGSKEKRSKVEKRAERARKYLALERKVDEKRLFIIEAGTRQETRIILQPVKRDLPPPNFGL